MISERLFWGIVMMGMTILALAAVMGGVPLEILIQPKSGIYQVMLLIAGAIICIIPAIGCVIAYMGVCSLYNAVIKFDYDSDINDSQLESSSYPRITQELEQESSTRAEAIDIESLEEKNNELDPVEVNINLSIEIKGEALDSLSAEVVPVSAYTNEESRTGSSYVL